MKSDSFNEGFHSLPIIHIDKETQERETERLKRLLVDSKKRNELCEKLIRHFGTVMNFLYANIDEYSKIPGMTKRDKDFILFCCALVKDCVLSNDITIAQGESIKKYFSDAIGKRPIECSCAIFFDDSGKALFAEVFESAFPDKNSVTFNETVNKAKKFSASIVITAHNHPYGPALPSAEDIISVKELNEIFKAFGIDLYDHIIVSSENATSIRNKVEYL